MSRDLVAVPAPPPDGVPATPAAVATVAANIASYGFALSAAAYTALTRAGAADLETW